MTDSHAANIDPVQAPVGGEVVINTTRADEQSEAVIAVLAGGSYVVAWQSFANGQANIYFQRYNAAGVAQGAETLVSATLSDYQAHPSLATLSDGSFVVVWESTSGSSGDIYARRYDAAGSALAAEARVNATIAGNQTVPDVAALKDGGYVVSWTSQAAQIYTQRYTNAGVAQGSETRVDDTSLSRYGNVVGMADGGYIVVWSAQDAGEFGVYMRRYDADGVALAPKVQVSTTTAGYQWFGDAALLKDGSFVVTWHSTDQYSANGDIYMRRYDAAGAALTGEVRANADSAGHQQYASVSALADGGYVIAWQTATSVYARTFDAAGTPHGAEQMLNTTTALSQDYPAIAGLPDGGFIAAWQAINGNESSWDVLAQRFAPRIETTEQTALDLKGMMSVTDTDGGSMTVHLGVDYGVLTVSAGGSGVEVSGSGTGAVTLTGTAAQINALLSGDASSVVRYTAHTDAPPGSATLTMDVDNGDGDSATILIAPVNDAPARAANASMSVFEGYSAEIDASALDYDDPEQGDGQIVYTITSVTANGIVQRDGGTLSIGSTFTQTDVNNHRISFLHDGSETVSASIGFSVSDGHGGVLAGQTLAITVKPINDKPTATDATFALPGDGWHTLSLSDFGFSDIEGHSFYQLQITRFPTGGQLMFVGSTETYPIPHGQVGPDHIVAGRIRYVPNPDASGAGYDSFEFQVMDSGWAVSTPHVITFDITPPNTAPTLGRNRSLNTLEGAVTNWNEFNLDFNDAEQPDAQIVYTVTSAVAHGTLRLNGVTLEVGGTFTQDDVTNERVTYLHDGSEFPSASFGFSVSDGAGGTVTGQTFTFNIIGLNDAPAFAGLDATPSAAGGPAVVLDGNATIADAELDYRGSGFGDYAGATLTLARQGGANAADAFGFNLSGAAFTVSGGDLQAGGLTFATFTQSGGTLTISFTSSATLATSALADDVLRHISYSNTSGTTGTAVLAYGFSDGNIETSQGLYGPATASGRVTVTLTGSTAVGDSATVLENATVAINVLANDLGADGNPIQNAAIATINGTAAQVGIAIALASGATATLNSDGTISYDPNGKYDTLISAEKAAWSGSSNSTAPDSFTYTLASGGTGTVNVTVHGVDSDTDAVTGTTSNDIIVGLPGNDIFDGSQGGDDWFSGGQGDDVFYFGSAYTALDTIRGGLGNDTLILQGNYFGAFTSGSVMAIEMLLLLSASETSYGASGTGTNSYSFDAWDQLVAPGARLTVQGNRLLAGETLVFNGGRETDGSFRLIGGAADDTLFGGAKDDMIVGGLGADMLNGDGGNDWFLYRDAAESNSASTDTIYDFDAGDWIDLSAIDADSTHAGNDPFAFIGSDDFHHVAGELRAVFDGAWWSVEGDIDGDGVADFVLAITTVNGHTLGVTDFTL